MKTMIAALIVASLVSPFANATRGESPKSCNGNNSSVGLHDNTKPESSNTKTPSAPKTTNKQTS